MPVILPALESELHVILHVFEVSLDAQYLKMLCCLQGDMGPVGIMGLLGQPGIKVKAFSFR